MAALHPKLVCFQILALQAWFYVVLCLVLFLFHGIFGTPLSLEAILGSKGLSVTSAPGWTGICLHVLTALVGCLLLVIIVERSKKCLDFAATLFIAHLCVVSAYEGLPTSWDWWIVEIVCLALMTSLGEFLCSRRELRDIPLFSPVPTDG
ncbi:unnamed protein product [Phaeothamnion confervicola]